MREVYRKLTKVYDGQIRVFPKKKLFGNKNHLFLQQRQKELQYFFDFVL